MAITNYTRFSENCKPSLLDHIYNNLTNRTHGQISADNVDRPKYRSFSSYN